jgi:hypothetical protein
MMSQDTNLKVIERQAWRSVFQDGLWDIYLGTLLMAMAVLTLLSRTNIPEAGQMAIYIGLMGLAMLALWAGKRLITVPRMGRVKFGPKGKARKMKARVLLAISVLVGVVVFLFTALALKGNWSEGLPLHLIIPGVWAMNMLVVFSLGAYFLHYERLYLIGVLYALPVPLDIWLDEYVGIKLGFIAFAVPAAIILIMGLVVFMRFLRDYPLPADGEPPDQSNFPKAPSYREGHG